MSGYPDYAAMSRYPGLFAAPRSGHRHLSPYALIMNLLERTDSFAPLFGDERGRSGPAGAVMVEPGEFIEMEIGYSEVCVRMRVAGQRLTVQLLEGAYPAVQLYVDGRKFSAPITPGEAGLYRDERGRHYYRR